MSEPFDYGRRFREIEQHMIADDAARQNPGKERPADSDIRPSLPGAFSSETEFDRLQKRVGLVSLDNEVLRDLLEVAWSTIAILSAGRNAPAEALRDRIWAHLHYEEATCPNCDHYIVNHGAAGPCACAECECQGNGQQP